MVFFNFKTINMEFKKTVRLNQEEQKLLESICQKLEIKTENKVFKHLVSNFEYQTQRIKNLEFQVEKLEDEVLIKDEKLQGIQDAMKLMIRFSKQKL